MSKPSLLLQMQIPATLDAEEALPQLLHADRVGQQWSELITSGHDQPASRGNPWWSTIVQELGGAASTDAADQAEPE